jgi:2-methylcitrate dehydratase PrpD
MNNTELLVETCLEDLPRRIGAEALANARHCLTDSLAAAFAAKGEPAILALSQTVLGKSGSGPCSVIAAGARASPEDAALVNGTMISLQLFDDNNNMMRGHPSAPLWPAVLALAEAQDSSLTEALAAFIIGYEVECRLGRLLNPSHYEIGWHATSTQGVIGATMAASRLLALEPAQARQALGLAASMASGVRRNFGTMTMSLHSGMAASAGLRAARLAQCGFTADPSIFDGTLSFGQVFSREWQDAALTQDLPRWGQPFAIVSPGPIFKLYPCGRPPLLAVDAAMAIQRKHGIAPNDIADILAEVSFLYPLTLIHTRPTNGLQGKTSLQYCIAATLVDGGPGLTSFTDEAVLRPEIARLIDVIRVEVPPHLSADIPEVRRKPFEQPVTLIIRLRDGRSFHETVRRHRGEPENPASTEDLGRKFADCTARFLGADARQAVLDAIASERFSVRLLMALLHAA